MTEKEIYYKLKKCYELLEISEENFDEAKLKSNYRKLSKKYHPDSKDGGNEEKFKEITNAYEILKDAEKRKIYKKLKEKYKNNREQKSHQCKETTKNEKNNKYIFSRRDGSKIEIRPMGKFFIKNQTIYCYEIIQYYKDITFINKVYGRINLNELMKDFNYCDFCINVFFNKSNIQKAVLRYNGYIGYIESANKNGRILYRIRDTENTLDDIYMEISRKNGIKYLELFDSFEDTEISVEDEGIVLVKGKMINQYLIFSDRSNIYSLVYGDKIDFEKMLKDKKYKKALLNLLSVKRLKSKISQDGYIGGLMYNFETDDYDIVMDDEIREVFSEKNQEF